MKIGASLVLLAIGAILRFAVTKQVSGIDVQTVGVVLMIVGLIGLVISMIMFGSRRRTDIVRTPNRTTYVEPVDPEARY